MAPMITWNRRMVQKNKAWKIPDFISSENQTNLFILASETSSISTKQIIGIGCHVSDCSEGNNQLYFIKGRTRFKLTPQKS